VPVPPPAEARLADAINIIVDNNPIVVINPFLPAGNTSPTQWTWTLIHDRLVTNLGGGEYGPMLAKSYTTNDYKTFIFDLRDDVVFHNGDRFTADDVIFTINTAQDSPGTLGAERWNIVESARAITPYQLELVLSAVHIDFLFDISSPPAGIVNQRAQREMDPDSWTWIGTGPFRVVEFESGSFVTVERFDDHWGEPAPTRQLTLRFVPEAGTRPLMLLNGEYHVAFAINSPDVPQFEEHPDFTVIPTIFNAPNCIGFNMEDPLMADRNFRMAIAHALDREEIAFGAAGVWAQAPDEGNTWGFGTEFRIDNIPLQEFNVNLARQYLAESSYNGETIEIAVTVRTNVLASEIIQQQLRLNLGIETTINEMDTPGFLAHVRTADTAQMHVFAASFTLSAAGSTRNVYYPGMGNNRTRYNDSLVSELIDRARGTVSLNDRRAIFEEMQRYIADDPPYFNLFWRLNPVVTVNGVDGMRLGYDALQYNLRGIYWVLDD
jgi:peptide/nickel transport system substrate-binding protein